MLRRFGRSVNELIPRDLLSRISKARSICEEGFFTEWKQGNTPYEKPRNPAFGGVFFFAFAHQGKCCSVVRILDAFTIDE